MAAADDARGAGQRQPGPGGRVALALRAGLYVLLVVGLSNLLLVEAIDRCLLRYVRRGVASLAGTVLSLFLDDVRAAGETVYVSASSVEIVNACAGFDVAIILASGMLVYPSDWGAKLRGVVLAFGVMLGTNFLRVITLCWLNAGSPSAFEIVHVYVWPVFISLVCLATLLVWVPSATPRDD